VEVFMANAGLDRKQPYKMITSFITGQRTIIQSGRKYTEQGVLVLGESTPPLYPCPKCDFGAMKTQELVDHVFHMHQGATNEKLMQAIDVYISNIKHGAPAGEGIDWYSLSIQKTPVREAAASLDREGKTDQSLTQLAAEEQAKSDAPPPVAVPEPTPELKYQCPHCPSKFASQPQYAGHIKSHKAAAKRLAKAARG
jgi:uncharacterized C2H2 Zn-finger protein